MIKILTTIQILLVIVLVMPMVFKLTTQNNEDTTKVNEYTTEVNTEYRFETIQEWEYNKVVYDKETKVQYFYCSTGITVLLDADGKPLLYEGE